MSLTAEGFARLRLAEIKSQYDQLFIDALGPVNTGADAVVGQVIGIFSAALDDVYEALQATYDAMYPSTAEGASLDGAVSFVGIERLKATATQCVAMIYGTPSTLVPAGALMRDTAGRQYATSSDVVISAANAGDAYISIDSVEEGETYQVISAGKLASYVAQSGDTESDIVDGMVADVDDAYFLATNAAGKLRMRAADQQASFALTVDTKMSVESIGSPVVCVALLTGASVLPANALTTVDTALVGLDAVNNLVAGVTGRDEESDTDLRLRHRAGVRATGSATIKAIQARMLAEVDLIEYCRVYENRTDDYDEFGLPPHSIETVVDGALDQPVASKLLELKPAGIETYGNVAVAVTDDNGDSQTMNFSRAIEKIAWVRVSVNVLYPEEQLPPTASDAIKVAVLSHGDSLSIGEDVISQRFYGPIYLSVSGIRSITVEVALTDSVSDTPSYTTDDGDIARTEVSAFDATRITVVGI